MLGAQGGHARLLRAQPLLGNLAANHRCRYWC
jgi:hypothetical protein